MVPQIWFHDGNGKQYRRTLQRFTLAILCLGSFAVFWQGLASRALTVIKKAKAKVEAEEEESRY